MGTSEAYRVMRRRAYASWRWLAAGAGSALAGAAAAGMAARHLPVCFWVLHVLGTVGQTAVACWGLRLTTGICLGVACVTGLVLGGQWLRTASARALRVQTQPLPAALAETAAALGLAGRLAVATDETPWALTRGFLRPAVVVSSGLLAAMEASELKAVLAHESHHMLRRDPLRLWVARAACAAFLWLPPARRILQAFSLASELASDAFAMERAGKRPLASALHKLASMPERVAPTTVVSVGMLGTAWSGGLAPRVAQIGTFPEAPPPAEDQWRLRGTGWAILGCAAAWSLLVVCAASLALR